MIIITIYGNEYNGKKYMSIYVYIYIYIYVSTKYNVIRYDI